MKNLIIGYGTVGKNLHEELKSLDLVITDRYKGLGVDLLKKKHNVGFVCVDTPLKDGTVDITEVVNAVNENDCEIYVIKSTIPVGTVEMLIEQTGKHIIFSPEYYGGTQHCNNYDFDFTILGGDKDDCVKVQNLLQDAYDARHTFRIVDSKTAEMVKFMENAWLATKVTFCAEFFKACEKAGIDYEDLRELFILDPRVNPAHTFVYRAHPYYKSHCLDKDVPSIANQFGIELLNQIIKINGENMKEGK